MANQEQIMESVQDIPVVELSAEGLKAVVARGVRDFVGAEEWSARVINAPAGGTGLDPEDILIGFEKSDKRMARVIGIGRMLDDLVPLGEGRHWYEEMQSRALAIVDAPSKSTHL